MLPYDPHRLIGDRFRREGPGTPLVSHNERTILSMLWDRRELTRSALAPQLELTQQSIHRIISQLEERGLIALGPLEPPSYKGKPSPRLLLNPDFACTIGISINTDSAGICVMDFAGSFRTATIVIDKMSVETTLAAIEAAIPPLLAQMRVSWSDVFAIGFAIAGFLVDGTRYNPPEPLVEWSELQLGPSLSNRFDKPVFTENSANMSTLCERMLGVGREVGNFAYLSFNYGFGGGIVLSGNLVRGGFGNAGEFSSIFPEAEWDRRPALAGLLKRVAGYGIEVSTIADLSRRFDPAWPGVEEWVELVTPYHDRVINMLSAVIDPEVIVLGGQIPIPLADMLIARCTFYSKPRHGILRRMPRLAASQIKGETAAIGAASLPLKEAFF
ncbi:ROK family transcriptional regulator [Rhizobium sp. SSA_523]|uniref:ROK family transcriptional regulator n=1 Tax=Rhizobium sp. SSA_523 TaxID=2952477 RepID=UPI002091196A|nr:ROK family transcriptional regulator [Rhizobium sp. SSA_523]MCO5733236.1 ROK family transcriptional regulator [Rhizobium sp. SSA_523]WKC21778.1 ROK family transcriptional regulator [Rhizobium sp. SSA_523]